MKETALITGPTSGIGLDLAHLFARDGHDVVLVARHEDKLQAVAADLERNHKVTAHVIQADLSDPAAPRRVFEETRNRGLQVDTLVNNAGFGLGGKFLEHELRAQLDMIQLNVTSLTQLTGLYLEGMVARGNGRILNLASTAAFQPGPLMAVYYATKAYVLSFSEAIAEELKDTGVMVTALCPGPTDTGFAEKAHIENTGLFKVIGPMSSMEVAQVGYKAMRKGKRVVIAGMRNKMTAQSVRVTPRFVVTKVVRALQERR